MIVPLEKSGTPYELVHFGKKGMTWGVRKNQVGDAVLSKGFGITTTSSRERAGAKMVSNRGKTAVTTSKSSMSTKKKVAIGVGAATVVVGVVATAYYLNKNGKIPLSSIGKRGGKVYKSLDDIPKVKVSAIAQASRTADRNHFIKLMMSSKKYTPTLEEATRIANETYGRL